VGGGLLWAFFTTTPAEASRLLGELVGTHPELVAGWVLLNAFFIIGAMFGSHRGRKRPSRTL